MLVKWENRYSVGVDIIDEQHKTLLNLINRLHSSMLEGLGKTKVFVTLQELASYSMVHFKTEEKMMEEVTYFDIENHKKEHESFKYDIASFIIKQQAGEPFIAQEVLTFLHEWVIDHITEIDSKYKPYVSKLNSE